MSGRAPIAFPKVRRAFAAARHRVLRALASHAPDGGPLGAVSRRLGKPVRLLGIDPVPGADPGPGGASASVAAGSSARSRADLDGDGELGAVCVHVRDEDGVVHLVRVSRGLAAAIAGDALGVEGWTLPAGEPPEPLLGVLSIQALRCLDALAAAGRPLELLDLHGAAPMGEPVAGAVPVDLRLSVGTTVGAARVIVGPGDPETAAPRAPAWAPPWLAAVPVPLAVVVARGRVRAGDLRESEPGDAIAFDEAAPAARSRDGAEPSGGRTAWLEPYPPGTSRRRWIAEISGDSATVVAEAHRPEPTERRITMSAPDDPTDKTTVIETPPEPLAGLEDVPVEVTAVAGRARPTLGELAAFAPGSVVPLGRSPTGMIDLLANGAPFARGRLVDLDGELAVEIAEIRATPPATPRK